jgi:hypothetical protein
VTYGHGPRDPVPRSTTRTHGRTEDDMDVIDVTERLMAEFEDRLHLDVITGIVHDCRRDLDASPAAALPELVERLARQRLLDASPREGDGPDTVRLP